MVSRCDFRNSQERTSENSVHAKFGTVRDQRRRQEKAGPLWEGGGTENARLEYWSNCSAGTGHSIYATRHIFVRHVATSGDELRRSAQRVEKVGAELKVATNRAPEATKSLKYGVFGARSGVEAGMEGVFQQ